MVRLMKLSSLGLAVTMMLSTIIQAQEERPSRDGARGDRSQQGERQGRARGGDQGRRGQRGGFPGGGFAGGRGGVDKLTLVAARPIQEELKLGEDELFLINKLVEDHRSETRALFSGIDFRSLSEEDRRSKFEELTKKRTELARESEKGLAEFLTEPQAKRLNEIAVQLQGVRALTDDDVAKKLKLTSDQKKKVEDALKAVDEDRRKMFEQLRAGGDGFEGMREKMEEARRKSDARVLAVLSGDQQKQFDEMKGKPFDVDRRALFNPGGRGRGGQDGGRPRGQGQGQGQRRDRGDRSASEGSERSRRPAAE